MTFLPLHGCHFPASFARMVRGAGMLLLLLAWPDAPAMAGSWLGRSVQDLLFVDPPAAQADSTASAFQEAGWEAYAGRTIASVSVLNADDFAEDDASSFWSRSYERLLHRPVDETRVRNYLLFKQGDVLTLFALSDSERLLRASSYVDDVRIVVRPSSGDTGAVDVLVVVRSTLPLMVEPRVHKLKSVGLVFSNKHLSPEGLDLSAGMYLQRGYKQTMGFTAEMGYENYRRTFLSPRIYYSDRKNLVQYGLSVDRPFAKPGMKYAGHVRLDRSLRTITGYYDGLLLVQGDEDPFVLHYHQYDLWFARAVLLPEVRRSPRFRRTLTFGFRYDALLYERRRGDWPDRFYALQDQHSLLLSAHFAHQAYATASRIYNFGRTEDIPEGWAAEVNVGRNFDEAVTRSYVGASLSGGRFLPSGGYVYLYQGFGGFVGQGRMTQATVSSSVSHFSRLYRLGRGEGRSFLTASYKRAVKPLTDDYLTLNSAGIAGVRSDSVRGQQRLVLKGESDFFTPWRLLGASSVLFAFCDVGWITRCTQRPVAGPAFASCGVGWRMRNERLVFSTVQIRLAFLLHRPDDVSFEQLSVSDDQRYRSRGFEPQAPERILINN